jgi:plasmid stabilization system protein ParE
MKLVILDRAEDDLVEAFDFYELQEPGLGDYFLSSLQSDIESLRLYAGTHRKAHRHLHRALSKRFPFGIYYAVESDEIRIHAVVDCRRKPSWIRKRLSGT